MHEARRISGRPVRSSTLVFTATPIPRGWAGVAGVEPGTILTSELGH